MRDLRSGLRICWVEDLRSCDLSKAPGSRRTLSHACSPIAPARRRPTRQTQPRRPYAKRPPRDALQAPRRWRSCRPAPASTRPRSRTCMLACQICRSPSSSSRCARCARRSARSTRAGSTRVGAPPGVLAGVWGPESRRGQPRRRRPAAERLRVTCSLLEAGGSSRCEVGRSPARPFTPPPRLILNTPHAASPSCVSVVAKFAHFYRDTTRGALMQRLRSQFGAAVELPVMEVGPGEERQVIWAVLLLLVGSKFAR